MAKVFVGYTLTGKQVAKDIFSPNHTKLISSGTVLTNNLIAKLKNYRVIEIEVVDDKNLTSGRPKRQAEAVQHRRSNEELHAFLKHIPLFATFNDEQIALTIVHSRISEYGAYSVIFRENEPGHSLLIILQGSIKIYTRSTDGEEKILSVVKQGDYLGELSLIDGKPRSASAQTLEETEVMAISRDNFLKLLKNNFDMSRSIMTGLAQRLQDTTAHIHDLAYHTTNTRVIKNLILLANRFGQRMGQSIHAKLPLNYDELAQMAGVNKRELGRVIRDLEDKQILRMHIDSFELNLTKT